MIVDTSALVAILQDEPERTSFIDLIDSAAALKILAVSFVEVSKVHQVRTPARARPAAAAAPDLGPVPARAWVPRLLVALGAIVSGGAFAIAGGSAMFDGAGVFFSNGHKGGPATISSAATAILVGSLAIFLGILQLRYRVWVHQEDPFDREQPGYPRRRKRPRPAKGSSEVS